MSESQEKHKRMVKRMKYILTEFEVRTWVADRVFPLVIMAQTRSAGHKSEKTRFRTLLYRPENEVNKIFIIFLRSNRWGKGGGSIQSNLKIKRAVMWNTAR